MLIRIECRGGPYGKFYHEMHGRVMPERIGLPLDDEGEKLYWFDVDVRAGIAHFSDNQDMTCLEIIKAYLEANKYDGLYHGDCRDGCPVDDLASCGGYYGDCKPGVAHDGDHIIIGPRPGERDG